MTNLNELYENLENTIGGIKFDGYDDEMFISREYGQYTIYVCPTEYGIELGTYKKFGTDTDEEEEIANHKFVKSVKAVNTYIRKFI